jgi:hypothetical protein
LRLNVFTFNIPHRASSAGEDVPFISPAVSIASAAEPLYAQVAPPKYQTYRRLKIAKTQAAVISHIRSPAAGL